MLLRLISKEEQCLALILLSLHVIFQTACWLIRKLSTCLMACHEFLLIAMNYRFITP